MLYKYLSQLLNQIWYENHPIHWFLWPFSFVYQWAVLIRRAILTRFFQEKFQVPVIVIGNLTVGGVGKTPLVIAIARQLSERGIRVGVVSRGYGASVSIFPYEVTASSLAHQVGDEPLLIAQHTGCPVVIAPKRVQAVRYLIDKHQCQVILSDDGLQHYTMGRSIEVAVIDGQRGLGNGLCLPAGPLRERERRLTEVDFVVVNGAGFSGDYRMDLIPQGIRRLVDGQHVSPNDLKQPIAAVAAIGNPQRFFETVQSLGIEFKAYSYPDHHAFKADDLPSDAATLLMTEKDAVKCRDFVTDTMYCLLVEITIDDQFWEDLLSHVQLRECFK